jgi:hypothetical protein
MQVHELTEIGGLIAMPNNVYDLTWLFFSSITVMLILALCGILWYWAKRICSQMHEMNKSIGKLYTSEAVTSEKVTTHIADANVHCKGVDCLHIKGAHI